VVVQDNLPPEAIYVSASAPGWGTSVSGTTLTFTVASLASGASSNITITVKAPLVSLDLTNTATVTSNTPDPNPANNQSTAVVTVTNQPGIIFPNTITPLAISKVTIPIITKGQIIYGPIRGLGITVASNYAFVDGVYRSLVNRPATLAEIQAGVRQLQAGLSRERFVSNLWNTDAHRAIVITSMFQAFYHRNPTAAELQAKIMNMRNGKTEPQMAYDFLVSNEYSQTHPTSMAKIIGFYQDLQGRIPDLATRLNMVNTLDNSTVGAVVNSILYSPETYSQIVDCAFRGTVRRPASANEIQYWVGQLQANQITPAGLIQKLLASSEFVNLTLSLVK
jgi:hypothetical protein